MIKKKFYISLVVLFVAFSSLGQYYYTDFGQSRIQYKSFDWVYYTTTHFDIYYYSGGGEYANQAIDFLEEEFSRLTDLLGYAPYSKTKIIIYNSINELQQSNIGIGGAVFTIGGQTDFVKLQLEIAHPGSAQAFKEELIYKLSRILIEDMLFGGSLSEIFQSSYLLTLPRWFIDGAARYLAYGWDQDMDDYIRDYLSEKHLKKLKKTEAEEAGLLGQAIWNYIALKYGRSNVSNILNLTRIMRNEEVSIASTIGVPYKQFTADWQSYYLQNADEMAKSYVPASKEKAIVSTKNREIQYHNIANSTTGRYVAYSENLLGKYSVFVYDKETGNTKKMMTGGYRAGSSHVDDQMPLIDWAGEDMLGVIYFKRGYLYLATINVETGVRLDKPLTRFHQIKSFSLNENGRLAILSGDVDGKNDIFLVSMRRNAVRRITSDVYDDLDPTFIPGTAAIVFSSNRPADSLNIADRSIEDLDDNFNLFLYDMDTTKNSYFRITNTYSKDFKPIAKNQYELFYLSDQRGVTNLFKYSFLDSTFVQISNYDKNIKDYDLHFNQNGIAYLMMNGGIDNIFVDDNVDLNTPRFTPQTQRQRIRQAKYIAAVFNARQLENLNKEVEEEEPEEEEPINPNEAFFSPLGSEPDPAEEESEPDSVVTATKHGIDPDKFTFEENKPGLESGQIDTDNYTFGGGLKRPSISKGQNSGGAAHGIKPESFFSNYQRLQSESNVYGPIDYAPQFSFNNLITSFAIDPLRGFGILLETQISDMIGNHVLTGGGMITTDFKSGDLFAEYKYLKYWLDFRLRVGRKSYFFENDAEDNLKQKYTLNRVMFGAALPLSNRFRVEFDPFVEQTDFSNLQYQSVVGTQPVEYAPDSRIWYTGARIKGVFDNTTERGFNILQGTRGSVELMHHQALNGERKTFSVFRADLRHYQRVHREVTLATRLFMGQSFGPNAQNFLLGGVPNWMFANTKQHSSGDPLEISNELDNSNLLFSEFVYNMRGFEFNEKYGNATLLFNAELRLPIFQYFSRAPVNSTFLRNFMLVSFFDMGSAWNGKPPFTRKNSANFITYENETFTANIANYQNPWLASYGFGLRTVLMGYYLKVDYARPIQDFVRQKPKFTVSVGLDF